MSYPTAPLRAPPSPSLLPYAKSSPRPSYHQARPAPLMAPFSYDTPSLDLSALGAGLMSPHTPPLSSASNSSSGTSDALPTATAPARTTGPPQLPRIISFGSPFPGSPLTGMSEHKRTLSFSAMLVHRPSATSISSFDGGEGKEEAFYASFPLPPGTEVGLDQSFSYTHIRRASLPTSDTASFIARMDTAGKLLDDILPTSSAKQSTEYPLPPARFRSRRSVYPESCHSVATTVSARPSRDDMRSLARVGAGDRDTMMSLPFVWADGSPIKRQPSMASTHTRASAKGSMRRNHKPITVYDQFPTSPTPFSPTASEMSFPTSLTDSTSFTSRTSSNRRRGRLPKRPSVKQLFVNTSFDKPRQPQPVQAPMQIETILEADPAADEQPSPVPSSACLPDSQWPSPVLGTARLPEEGAGRDVMQEPETPEAMTIEDAIAAMERIFGPMEPEPVVPTQMMKEKVPELPKSSSVPICLKETRPLRLDKELPLPPAALEVKNVNDIKDVKAEKSEKAEKYGKKDAKDMKKPAGDIGLWRTMVAAPPLPVQPLHMQEKIKQALHMRSAQSSPSPISTPRRTPSPVKPSPPRPARSPSPTKAAQAPARPARSPSPVKVSPPRPVRSPSPLFLDDIQLFEDLHSPLRSAAASPGPSPFPFAMRSSPNLLSPLSRPRRDSFDSFRSSLDLDGTDDSENADKTSLLRVPPHSFAQQIPSKAARKLGVSEDVVMVLTRSPSRSSNFSEHNSPASPLKPKTKNPFGNFFGGTAAKKVTKGKLEISLPIPTPVEPVVLYTPAAKTPASTFPVQQSEPAAPTPVPWEPPVFPVLVHYLHELPLSPAVSTLAPPPPLRSPSLNSPKSFAQLKGRRREVDPATIGQQWI